MKLLKLFAAVGAVSFLAVSATAFADNNNAKKESNTARVTLPLAHGWFNGKVAYYISTDASDAGVAAAMGANFVPSLANAALANPSAVDDIYVVTNFTQSNILPSAPIPAGPRNANAAYSPLWNVSTVTWNAGTKPYTLKSEADVRNAELAKLVVVNKTSIVVNCPVVFTSEGGKLPGVTFDLD